MTEAQLRAFVAVAETGSFGQAARDLHLSQPGISRAVSAAEQELGGQLLSRSHGTVEVTSLGERVLVRARAVLSELDSMRQDADAHRGLVSGHVRLGSMPSVSAVVLPALLAHVKRRHPALSVTVLDGHDDELVQWLRAGTVDIAVVAGRHTGLAQQPLLEDEFLAVLPADHALAAAPVVSRAAFAELPFILTQAGCERLVLGLLRAVGVTPSVQHEVTEASTIVSMVSARLGVSIMPALAAPNPPQGVVLLPLRPRAKRPLFLAYPTGRTPTPATAVVLKEAADVPTHRLASRTLPPSPLGHAERSSAPRV